MLKDFFKKLILEKFGHQPTPQQAEVVGLLTDFLLSENRESVFILRGYAGTGKTSLISALVRSMDELERECVLIAPTGRAAKVFSAYSGHPAYTIHKRIYRQKTIDQDSIFSLNYNLKANLLFICDEASMISNQTGGDTVYGTGMLLDDLIHFVYNGRGCRLILMGDTAQLPPVGDEESPALQDKILEGYGIEVISYTLTQVVRQSEQSGILWNATHLRSLMQEEKYFALPQLRLAGFPDVHNISGAELIETLEQCYQQDGYEETIVITRSNKRANIYNNGIRNQILWREEEISSGDMLMIARNNYLWTEGQPDAPDFIANGDIVRVERVRNEREFFGFHFVDVELTFPDYDDYSLNCTILLDALHAEAPSLTSIQQQELYNRVMEDYADLRTKKERLEAMKKDPYYNALQVKYAYAITCHKAQGGQWLNTFIDQGYMTDDMLTPDYFRWLYTAITRTTGNLYLVNWKDEQTLQ